MAPRSPGIADRTGSLTPGKKADLVIIDGEAVNVAPVIDPVGAVVCAADISNVRTVLVDGQVVKDDFKLVAGLDAPRRAVEASRDYLIGKFGEPEPGWLPTGWGGCLRVNSPRHTEKTRVCPTPSAGARRYSAEVPSTLPEYRRHPCDAPSRSCSR